MIKQLHLEDYGRFKNKSFDFTPVTIFYGPNEAGKTTIFDAICDVIISVKNVGIGKKIVERYGKNRKVKPVLNKEPLKITIEDFRNIFAIRAGSISLEIEKDSEWMNKVKDSLFSGGIDPATVLKDLKKTMETKEKGSLNTEDKKLKEYLANLTNEKNRTEEFRAQCIKDEKQIANKEKDIDLNAKEIIKLKAEQKELEEKIEQQNLLAEEKNCNNNLILIADFLQKKEEIEKLSHFDLSILNSIKEIETQYRQIEIEYNKCIDKEEELNLEITNCLKEKKLSEANKNKGDTVRVLADTLYNILVPKEKLEVEKTMRIWKKPILIAAGIFFIAGSIAFVVSDLNFIFLAAALGTTGICFAFSGKTKIYKDSTMLHETIETVRKRWQAETGEDIGTDYQAILSILGRAGEKSRFLAAELERVSLRTADIEQKIQNNSLNKNKMGNELDRIKREHRSILERAGTNDTSQYAKQLGIKDKINSDYNDLNNKINNLCNEFNTSSYKELKNKLELKKIEIAGKITDTTLLVENEKRNLENKLKTVKDTLEKMHYKDKENSVNFEGELRAIRERQKGLPEKIFNLEKEIINTTTRIDEIKKEVRSLQIAHELFSSLMKDSGSKLEQLSLEIGKYFSSLTEPNRKINMKNYSIKETGISDSQGIEQIDEHLSTGTKDAFLLAARLCLAKKSLDKGAHAIIVLDEPFLALDKERTNKALVLLQEFHKETQWQIVLLTKDKELTNQAKTIFGKETVINELGS